MIRARDFEDGATYITGLYAPVAEEHDFAALVCIEGEIPSDLAGVFARNAPNPKFAPPEPYHWFDGDGMVHAVTFAEGRATYRNRWVRTKGLADDEAAGKALRPGLFSRPDPRHPDGPFKNTANTDLLAWQGRLLALWWLGEGTPYALDPHSLETRGLFTAAGTMTAHAKVDPRSGDLVFIDYGMRPPFLTHGVLSPDGSLRRTAVELPGPRPQHDIALTERYTVLIDTSMFADPQALATGRVHMRFFADTPTRLGLFDRRAHELVRWFEVPPCYVYHFANAWEREDGKVVVVASRVRDPLVYDPQPGRSEAAVPRIGHLRLEPQLVRWTLDLESGEASEDVIDEAVAEFPRVDDSRLGAPTRAAYLGSFAAHESLIFAGVRRVDLERGTAIERRFPPGWCGGEVSVLPRGDDEDQALLATFVSPDDGGPGELWLLAAADLEVVARLRIPARVPAGFHTRWLGA